ncbi:coiled-coil domain-containing protein 152-like [Argopecten irradians]|uniref:coiled-coil domain-containing protein 152-like n=1 Tax=Argopecten irradians TaxID=31199 RepID=UPI003724480D
MEEGDKSSAKSHNKKCLELDCIIDTFDNWQLAIVELVKRKSELSEEAKNVKADKERLERKIVELEKSVSDLQGMIDTLHKQLHTVCDMDENIRKGQAELRNKITELHEAKSELHTEKIKHSKLMEEMLEKHSEEKSKLIDSMNKEKKEEVGKLYQIIEQKNDEICEMQQKLNKSINDKESEILKMSMDYENKLSKLKQKTSIPPAQSSSSNQEIFRKKLQHLKTEYEREINHLKYAVSDLQEKLASQGNTGRITVSSDGKKRRL